MKTIIVRMRVREIIVKAARKARRVELWILAFDFNVLLLFFGTW